MLTEKRIDRACPNYEVGSPRDREGSQWQLFFVPTTVTGRMDMISVGRLHTRKGIGNNLEKEKKQVCAKWGKKNEKKKKRKEGFRPRVKCFSERKK